MLPRCRLQPIVEVVREQLRQPAPYAQHTVSHDVTSVLSPYGHQPDLPVPFVHQQDIARERLELS